MQGFDFVIACLAALAAGAVNALAGGGTLITFSMLTFLGVPAVAANVANTVALCPGYFGGTLAQGNFIFIFFHLPRSKSNVRLPHPCLPRAQDSLGSICN